MSAKLHPRLAQTLDDASSREWFDVIVELRQPDVVSEGSRSERIATRQSTFQAVAEPVKAAIEREGGVVQDEAWINSTLRCHLPVSALKTLRDLPDVIKVDFPQALSSEG